ncbi:ComEA family DNA-binding protein [Nocardioides sp.]|jgi:competence protein ComEA|uniref:ComEA family DNA-binding protein n=1 Tax=Nocardioides sp. TaxID=35761 RepID=UPI002F42FE42
MRSRSLAAQHDAAVARRLELLTTELATVRVVGDLSEPAVETAGRLDDEVGPAPSVARLPGRHASRRTPSTWVLGLPDVLRGRVALGSGQLAVVAVLAVVGLALTCWWLVRSGGHELAAPSAPTTPRNALATPDGSSTGGPGAAKASAGTGKVVVDVAGKVRRPGIAVLRQGARVIDAVRAAGGARPGVDLAGLNLARVLTDGEQVVVGQAAAPVVSGSASAGGSPVGTLVNINTADETALESLPEVGPVTAQSIITWRTQHGGFTSVDQLLDVDGIGDATLAKLTPYVTI